jgi:DHA1 family multidrug resistance protein-like MFS transporter
MLPRPFFDKMKDTIRDSPFGQLIRLLTRNKLLQYPDKTRGFQYPEGYEANSNQCKEDDTQEESYPTSMSASNADVLNEEKKAGAAIPEAEEEDTTPCDLISNIRLKRHISTHIPTERITNGPIVPKRTSDGTILVNWYTTGITIAPHRLPLQASKLFTELEFIQEAPCFFPNMVHYVPHSLVILD